MPSITQRKIARALAQLRRENTWWAELSKDGRTITTHWLCTLRKNQSVKPTAGIGYTDVCVVEWSRAKKQFHVEKLKNRLDKRKGLKRFCIYSITNTHHLGSLHLLGLFPVAFPSFNDIIIRLKEILNS